MHCHALTAYGQPLARTRRSMESPRIPVSGNASPVTEKTEPNAFERLVQIFRLNERFLEDLQRLNGQLQEARDYLIRPQCNVVLGMARLDRVKRRRSLVLCRLRANRIEADGILRGGAWREAGD